MAFLRVSLLAILAATAVASPFAKRQSEGYELKVANAKLTAINANGAAFWTGKHTKVVCPDIDCSSFPNVTTVDLGSGGAGMYANVPGGQDIYIAPSGALSFTEPHEEGIYPNGSLTSTFELVQSGSHLFFEFVGGNSKGWATCGDLGQVFALIPGVHCDQENRIRIRAEGVTVLGAFEYE